MSPLSSSLYPPFNPVLYPTYLELLLGGVHTKIPEKAAQLLGGHEASGALVEGAECLLILQYMFGAQGSVSATHAALILTH